MTDKTTAILNHVSQTIYNVRQSCIATAISSQTLQVSDAQDININGLNLTNQASGTVRDCKQTNNTDMQNIYGNMDTLLNNVITAANGMQAAKRTFIATLKSSITVDVVNQCTALAVSATKILVTHTSTASFDDVHMTNIATAAIQKCLQSVSIVVGQQPQTLESFVQQNEPWMTSVVGASPPPASQTNVQQFQAQRCAALKQQTETAWFLTAVFSVFGVAVSALL